jgi:hypothetical protein
MMVATVVERGTHQDNAGIDSEPECLLQRDGIHIIWKDDRLVDTPRVSCVSVILRSSLLLFNIIFTLSKVGGDVAFMCLERTDVDLACLLKVKIIWPLEIGAV